MTLVAHLPNFDPMPGGMAQRSIIPPDERGAIRAPLSFGLPAGRFA